MKAGRTLVVAAVLGLLSANVHALAVSDVIAAWDMTGQPGNQVSTPASDMAVGVAASAMTRGAGIGASSGNGSMSSNGWDSTAASPAADTDYFSFGFDVEQGLAVNLLELVIGTRSSNPGPGTLGLYFNGDNFSNPLHTFVQPGSGFLMSAVDLSGLVGLTGEVEFRLIEIGNTQADGSGDTTSGGSFRVVNFFDTDVVPAQLTGVVVPLPAAVWLLASALGGLVMVRRSS